MRRFTFYVLIALLTFGVGSFIAFNLFWKTENIPQRPELKMLVQTKMQDSKTDKSNNTFSVDMTKPLFHENMPEKNEEKGMFCKDKNILRVWRILLKDKDFQEWQPDSRESLDCKDMLEVKDVDLNQDGRKEILLRGKSLCSPVGNCAFWIFERKGKNYRKILYSTDFWEITKLGKQVQKSKTRGYFDILLKGHFTASETTYQHYSFIGGKYKLVKDLIDACIVCSGENPKWKIMTWKEYEKLHP